MTCGDGINVAQKRRVTPGLLSEPSVPEMSMHYRVLGPDGGSVSAADLRRLFRGQRLSQARRNRLAQGGRILVLCGSRVVGIAAFDRSDVDVRVYEVGLDAESVCATDDIINYLLDALELACMASGTRRLILLPGVVLNATITRHRGYVMQGAGHPGACAQKTFA
jgi:hypothetical protein